MNKKLMSLLTAVAIVVSLSGCTNSAEDSEEKTKTAVATASEINVSEMFTDSDKEVGYDEENSSKIELNKTTVTSNSNDVSIDGTTVTIKNEGTYIVSGDLENGKIIVDSEKTDKLQIVLNGANISCKGSAPIYVKQADKVFLTLANETTNTLTSIGEYETSEDNVDAAIFSKDDLTLNGTGILTVKSESGHGIVSKDDLVVTSGTYSINAASHGLSANDSIRIADGKFNITSGKDGLHSENTDDTKLGYIYVADGEFNITAGYDALDASSAIQSDGGTFDVTTGEGSAKEASKRGGAPEGEKPSGERPKMPSRDGEKPTGNPPSGSENEEPPVKPDVESSQQNSTSESGNTTNENTSNKSENTNTTENTSTEESTNSMKGLKAETNLVLNGGTYNIDSCDDSIHSNKDITITDGTYSIKSGDDAIHAEETTKITNGNINVTKSYEGIEGLDIELKGGKITVVADDDGINAAGGNDDSGTVEPFENKGGMNEATNGSITISGGTIDINASGDGIDANGNLTVTGGTTYVSGSENGGNSALDYSGDAKITGGTFVAVGMSEMSQNFGDESTQGVIMINKDDTQEKDTKIILKDSSGEELVSYTSKKSFNSVLVSCKGIEKDGSYTLSIGDEDSAVQMSSLVYSEGTRSRTMK